MSFILRRPFWLHPLLVAALALGCGREVPPPKLPASSGEGDGPLLPLASDVDGSDVVGPGEEPEPSEGDAEAAAIERALSGDVPGGILAPGQADKIIGAGTPPALTLVSAGGEPRDPIRYALPKPGSEKLEMSLEMSIANGPTAEMAQPPVRIEFEVKRKAPNAEGDAPIDVFVRKAEVSMKDVPKGDPAVTAMKEALDAAKSLVIHYELTPRGLHKNVDVQMSDKANPLHAAIAMGVAQAYRATATFFPEEPVGEGATWRVTSRHQEGGSDLVQIATYLLKKRSGAEVSLEVKTRQLAASPDVAAPIPGMTMRLLSLDSGGISVHGIDLGEATPRSGRSENSSKMSFEMSQNGKVQRGDVENDIAIAFGRSLTGG